MNLSSFAHTFGIWLTQARHITLIAHKSPDGDAIGSLVGLALLIHSNLPEVRVCVCLPSETTPLDAHLSWLLTLLEPGIEIVRDIPADCHHVIILDCHSYDRTALPETSFSAKSIMIIDHHVPKIDIIDSYIDTDFSSTTLILTELSQILGWTCSTSASTALLTGLYTDTG
jgi:bifunctional oligoribonuclease and PAP phosphatase NrnA